MKALQHAGLKKAETDAMLGDEWTRWGGCVVLGVIGVDLTSMDRMGQDFHLHPSPAPSRGKGFRVRRLR